MQTAELYPDGKLDIDHEEAWALGFMFGDGWVTQRQRQRSGIDRWGNSVNRRDSTAGVQFVTCVANSPEHEDRVKRCITYWSHRFGAQFKLTPYGYFRSEKAELGRHLHQLGLGVGAKTKRVPNAIFEQAAHVRKAFLDGFAAADGSLNETGQYSVQVIYLANRALVEDLRHLARGIGHRVTNITEIRRTLKPPHSTQEQEWFSASFRYHWRTMQHQPYRLALVKSVKPCGRALVFDLAVEDAENFIADGLVAHNTRWHVDDLVGRFTERFPGEVRMLRYKAIAEEDEEHRQKGIALFPELKPFDFLMERKSVLTQAGWSSEYQQSPIVIGGGQIPVEKLKVRPQALDRRDIRASVRFVDKAGTEGGDGAYTAMVLMHAMKDKTYVIEHIARGRWGALEREQRIKELAQNDKATCKSYEVGVEQEPGSGGKESAESTVRNLAGFRAYADKVTGSKDTRAEPFAAQVQNGNVSLIAGTWVLQFLDECEFWPFGKYRDQVDACSGAFNRLTLTNTMPDYKSWVG